MITFTIQHRNIREYNVENMETSAAFLGWLDGDLDDEVDKPGSRTKPSLGAGMRFIRSRWVNQTGGAQRQGGQQRLLAEYGGITTSHRERSWR